MLLRSADANPAFTRVATRAALRSFDGAMATGARQISARWKCEMGGTLLTPFDPKAFLAGLGEGRSNRVYAQGRALFAQGEPADAVFYVQRGKVKLSLLSPRGREAVIAILGAGDFVGEGCLGGQPVRMATATAIGSCSALRVERAAMLRALIDRPEFATKFIAHLLSRNIRIEQDLHD